MKEHRLIIPNKVSDNPLCVYNLTIVNDKNVKTVYPLKIVKSEKTFTEFKFIKKLEIGEYKYYLIEVNENCEQSLFESGILKINIPTTSNNNIITKSDIKHGTF